jgi:hypothetical protein
MNADYLIANAKQTSNIMYRDGAAEDRLAYQVGLLEVYIKQLCITIKDREEEIIKLSTKSNAKT